VFGRIGAAFAAFAATLSGSDPHAAAERAERRLREGIDALPEGIVFLDAEGRYILWNKRYAEIYERSSDLFREGAKLADTLRIGVARGDYPQAIGREEAWLAERMALLEQPGQRHEQQLANGRRTMIEQRKTADGGNNGRRVDITELKKQAAALEAALARAEAANRAKSEFLARVSHELRTPLNGVMGMADVLRRTAGADQSEAVQAILASSDDLALLINNLLDFNTLEAGQVELRAEPFAIATAVRDAAQAHDRAAAAKGISLTIEIAEAAETHVLGDAGRVRQIVGNLVSNAVKFTESGHIDVALDADRTEEGMRYRIAVRDTGPGFSSEVAERIFQRFEQADASSTTRHGGMGLGLAICRQLSERMGGWIRAEAAPGRGAVFTVSLPLPLAATPDTGPDAPEGPPLKVLLADDNATNRRVVEMMLAALGAEVVSVEDGAQAVEAARGAAFDIVLMDLRMPVMDGLTAIRTIRAMEAERAQSPVPMVVLSANVSAEDRSQSLEAGADAHIGKPIQADTLVAAINQVLS
jgi:signal transduction histidine kinase/CheY-like chemotaxis protein